MLAQSGSGAYYVFVTMLFLAYWAGAHSRLLRLSVVFFANVLFSAHFGIFYAWLLPACSTLDFVIGLGLMDLRSPAVRRALVSASVCVHLALLLASRHMGVWLNLHSGATPAWDWVFPLGLSFYTFQSLTYTLDLYRKDGEGTRSLLTYLATVSFFPTLQAGPICRVTELVKQFANPPALTRTDGGRALFLIATGLAKKALIADYLAANFVNRVFDTPNLYTGAEALLAVYAYSLQLYYDFSGYTDMARGAGLLLGIRLPENFARPYEATNLTDFWRRWHISFSNWLRDYLYFSLPGNRTRVMPYVNLIVTMVLGGLWHGLTWPFAVWGLLHGVGLAGTRAWLSSRPRKRPAPTLAGRIAATIGTYHFVCLGWLFFRAPSLAVAMSMLSRIASLTGGLSNLTPALALVIVGAALLHFLNQTWYARSMDLFARSPFYLQAAALALMIGGIQYLGGRGDAPFVYSRF